MVLARASVILVEQAPKHGSCQCLCPKSELQLSPSTPGGSPRSSGGSDPGSFQVTASALDPGAGEILCVTFTNRVSIFYSPLAFLKVSPTGLQSQAFWGLVFLVQDPRLGSLMWNSDPSLLGKKLCNCYYPPICGPLTWVFES